MPPAVIAAGVGVAGAVGGAAISSSAAKKAGKVQAASAAQSAQLQQQTAREAMGLSREQFQQTRADLTPWRMQGQQAAQLYGGYLGLPQGGQPQGMRPNIYGEPQRIQQDQRGGGYLGRDDMTAGDIMEQRLDGRRGFAPMQGRGPTRTQTGALQGEVLPPVGQQPTQQPMDFKQALELNPQYQFLRQEGMRGIERSAAARGSLQSGRTLKALSRYGQDLAYGMSSDYLNRLQGVSGQGLGAAAQTGALGAQAAGQQAGMVQQMGRGMGQAYQQGAGAQAAGYLGSAGAWGQGIQGIGQEIGGYLGYTSPTGGQSTYQLPPNPNLNIGPTPVIGGWG